MTKEEVIATILEVTSKFKYKYSFNEFEPDDIQQEAYFLCVDALNRYDGQRSLKNFLSVHLSKRLKNFRRDKLVRALDSMQLEETFDINESPCQLHLRDFDDIVDSKLNATDREDYLKLKDGVHLPRIRLHKLRTKIHTIVEAEVHGIQSEE